MISVVHEILFGWSNQ